MAEPNNGDKAKRKRYKPDNQSRWLEFGTRLKVAIQERGKGRDGYTAADLARELMPRMLETPQKHVRPDSSTIGLWKRNVQRPPLETIVLLAECLNVDPGWLAFGSFARRSEWPAWVYTTWADTGGEVPREREGRYKARHRRMRGNDRQ
jgi:hypothetical protein